MAMAECDKLATVLVVEDETLIRMVSVDAIQEAGYKVIEAESADEALAILENSPAVQLLFTDIRMPGSMDGLTLASLVHARWPNIRLLVTSGHRRMRNEDLPDDGRFVPKPYLPATVVDKIRDLLPNA